jgi:hypothetical protein
VQHELEGLNDVKVLSDIIQQTDLHSKGNAVTLTDTVSSLSVKLATLTNPSQK